MNNFNINFVLTLSPRVFTSVPKSLLLVNFCQFFKKGFSDKKNALKWLKLLKSANKNDLQTRSVFEIHLISFGFNYLLKMVKRSKFALLKSLLTNKVSLLFVTDGKFCTFKERSYFFLHYISTCCFGDFFFVFPALVHQEICFCLFVKYRPVYLSDVDLSFCEI